MPTHHHVNLAVRPGGIPEQRSFLVDVLGYREVEISDAVRAIAPRAQWFEGEDGGQVHLSEDPDHRPAERAHVAVTFAEDELDLVQDRLASSGVEFTSNDPRPGFPRVILVRDPAGNRWELRASE